MDFDRLVRRHKDSVYSQMVRVCGNKDDADDVLAEALLSAFRFSSSLKDPEAFQGWLASIARRVCFRLRSQAKLKPVYRLAGIDHDSLVSEAPSPQRIAELSELKSCVREAVDSLPPNDRSAYTLRELEGLTGEEAARQLGISLPALKTRLLRARAKLRAEIEKRIACLSGE